MTHRATTPAPPCDAHWLPRVGRRLLRHLLCLLPLRHRFRRRSRDGVEDDRFGGARAARARPRAGSGPALALRGAAFGHGPARLKRVWTKIVPEPAERPTYVLLSSLALVLLFALWQPIGGTVWSLTSEAGASAVRALYFAGWGMLLYVTALIDHFDLFGLRQAWLAFRGRPYAPHPFKTPGLYKHMRHPLYVSWAIIFWASPVMSVGHLLFAVVATAYMVVAVLLEERDLVGHFGDAYRHYQESTPRYIPRLRTRRGTADRADHHRRGEVVRHRPVIVAPAGRSARPGSARPPPGGLERRDRVVAAVDDQRRNGQLARLVAAVGDIAGNRRAPSRDRSRRAACGRRARASRRPADWPTNSSASMRPNTFEPPTPQAALHQLAHHGARLCSSGGDSRNRNAGGPYRTSRRTRDGWRTAKPSASHSPPTGRRDRRAARRTPRRPPRDRAAAARARTGSTDRRDPFRGRRSGSVGAPAPSGSQKRRACGHAHSYSRFENQPSARTRAGPRPSDAHATLTPSTVRQKRITCAEPARAPGRDRRGATGAARSCASSWTSAAS